MVDLFRDCHDSWNNSSNTIAPIIPNLSYIGMMTMPELNLARYTPKEKLLPSQWAERNVLVPAGNARPGKISFREAPFQRGILDTCVDPSINRISVMSAAQVGKTMVAVMLDGLSHGARADVSGIDAADTDGYEKVCGRQVRADGRRQPGAPEHIRQAPGSRRC